MPAHEQYDENGTLWTVFGLRKQDSNVAEPNMGIWSDPVKKKKWIQVRFILMGGLPEQSSRVADPEFYDRILTCFSE